MSYGAEIYGNEYISYHINLSFYCIQETSLFDYWTRNKDLLLENVWYEQGQRWDKNQMSL